MSRRSADNLTAHMLNVSCCLELERSVRLSVIDMFRYRMTDVPEWRTMRIQSRGSTEATISNLMPGREYELMVLSQDSQGDGMFSKAFRARTQGMHKEKH